jgi:hypothetical protein
MTVGEILDRTRDLYCRIFSETLDKLAKESPGDVHSEVALRDASGRPVGGGPLDLPLRVDMILLSSGRSISVDSDRIISFSPISFMWADELAVRLGPFHWDQVTVRFPCTVPPASWAPLCDWFRRWYQEEEDSDSKSLLGVAHFLSDPKLSDGWGSFEADLGSAPVEAFEQLLDAIQAIGVREVHVGRASE